MKILSLSQMEVLCFLCLPEDYPLPRKVNQFGIKEPYKRHSKAFKQLCDGGLAYIKDDIWALAESKDAQERRLHLLQIKQNLIAEGNWR